MLLATNPPSTAGFPAGASVECGTGTSAACVGFDCCSSAFGPRPLEEEAAALALALAVFVMVSFPLVGGAARSSTPGLLHLLRQHSGGGPWPRACAAAFRRR